ncbi:hypothetical protein ACP54N_16750 [Enterobacter hormaechei]|uniref:hypothetical protein n=1 Tax=Enterobacter hormaechei TaxID=158836 RepID=UPI003CE6C4EF
MANSLTAIFTSLLALPDLDRNRIAELLQRNDKKPMQTTSLRLRPGTRQLIDELSGKIGISQSELLSMVIEGSFRDIFLPFSNTAISVIDRFELLMQSHELSPTDIAELLSSWNVRVSVLQCQQRVKSDPLTATTNGLILIHLVYSGLASAITPAFRFCFSR